jgi:hypothetical protein
MATPNFPPIANAGSSQNVSIGFVGGTASRVVTLDGTGSTDPDHDVLTFAWTLLTKPTGSTAVLSRATDPKPTFTADVAGTYTATLIVSDGKLISNVPSVVTIVASISNSAPVANAGVKQFVVFGASSTVTLDGTYSTDSDNDQLFYKWTLVSKPTGSAAVLSSASDPKPTFTANLAGEYVFALQVNDGKVDSAPNFVVIVASAANAQPVANAGDDKNVVLSTIVSLDGTNSSDANLDTLTYQWDWMTSPGTAPALSSATSPKPTFTPTTAGTYVLSLTVSDGKLKSNPDPVSINVTAVNAVPVAVPGADRTVTGNGTVTLSGSGTDANGDTLTYKWYLLYKPTNSVATLALATTQAPTFVPDQVGIYLVTLIVNDGKVDSAPEIVTITRSSGATNVAPVANAGKAQTVVLGTVNLDGSSSTDTNGDSLTYKWFLTSKPINSAAVLSTTTAAKPTIDTDVAGVYVFSLVVNDGKLDSSPVSTVVTVSNTPKFGTISSDTLSTSRGNDTIDGGAGIDTVLVNSLISNYYFAKTPTGYTLVDKTGLDGTDTLLNIESIKFADKTINLTVQAKAASSPPADVTRLVELYTAFFNRVPDADGMSFWIDEMKAGKTTNQVAEAFYNAGVNYSSLTGFSSSMTNADFINVIYKNVLGRKDGADAGGLSFWETEITSGRATRGTLVTNILDSAHTFKGNATWGWVADLLDNKITVAKKFSIDMGLNYNTPEESITKGMAIASAITSTDTSAAVTLIGVTEANLQLA